MSEEAGTQAVREAGEAQEGDATSARSRALRGVEKAAVFILALEEDDASLVLRGLSDEELARLTNQIAGLGVVEKETVASVLEEFLDLERAHGLVREGGREQAARLLEKCFPRERAERILRALEAGRPAYPFAALEKVEADALAALLEDEPPHVLAVVLAHMRPAKAGEVLDRLAPELRREVVERIAALEPASAEALREVELALEKQVRAVPQEPVGAAGGASAVARILRASRTVGPALLAELREERPELAEEIGKHLVDFEDFARLEDRTVQLILRDVDLRTIAAALEGASDAVRQKIVRNLSRRAAEQLFGEIAALGRLRRADVEEARLRVVRAALALGGAEPLAVAQDRADRT